MMTMPQVQSAWWVVCRPSEQNSPTIPADAKIISTRVGSNAYNTLLHTDTGTVNGMVRYMGPFPSQTAAKSAAPGKLTAGDWTGAVIAGLQLGAGNVPNPKSAVGTGFAVGTAVDTLGRFNLGAWFLRIGEILLGLVLIGVGIARITGLQNAVSEVVKTKLPIPIPL
jgi:hypothetical protein